MLPERLRLVGNGRTDPAPGPTVPRDLRRQGTAPLGNATCPGAQPALNGGFAMVGGLTVVLGLPTAPCSGGRVRPQPCQPTTTRFDGARGSESALTRFTATRRTSVRATRSG